MGENRYEGNEKIGLFHCVANYPAKAEDMNLKSIAYMHSLFNFPVGLSDHTIGVAIPNAAIALGAKMIEKHFTLDKSLPGPDHQLSANPEEFKIMVDTARLIEVALGSATRPVVESNSQITMLRRSLTARTDILAGTVLTPDLVAIKRPGDGIHPEFFDFIIGRKMKINLNKDEQFKVEMFT